MRLPRLDVVLKCLELTLTIIIPEDVEQWLQDFDAEGLLTLALLAEAGDEGLALIRLTDREDADTAEMSFWVADFVARRVMFLLFLSTASPPARIQHLFIDGAVLTTNGYVAHALGLLRNGCLVKFCGPAASRMTPPTQGTLNRSLGRMQAWCKLAVEVCRAEFPDYGVFCAFGIFNLSVTSQSAGAGQAVLKLHDTSVERLAQLFQVCPRRLLDQVAKHRPVAAKLAAESACGNREAWQKALMMSQSNRHTSQAYAADALKPVLLRYLSWRASTSAVEQGFSQLDRCGPAMASSGIRHETVCLRALLAKASPAELEATCRAAHELYSQCGPTGCRRHGKDRIDRGCKRHMPQAEASEQQWLKLRRTSVADSLKAAGGQASDAAALDPTALPSWSETHAKELLFQQDKQRKKLLEAFLDKLLLKSEQPADLRAQLNERNVKNKAADKALLRKKHNKALLSSMTGRLLDVSGLGGKKVWLPSVVAESRQARIGHGLSLFSHPA